jgi:phosphoribosylaminoimidazole-succinocarboxamide synthase
MPKPGTGSLSILRGTFVKTGKEAAQQLSYTLHDTDFGQWLGRKETGKARDNYVRGDKRFIIATDRVSAFDSPLGCIPFKGQVVTQMSVFWFTHTADIIGNHLLAAPDENVLLVKECSVIPVEMVVRAYLTGVTPTAIWYQYERGARSYCGHQLPDGLKKNARLPEPIITPSTKAAKGGRDESISSAEVLARSLVDKDTFEQMTSVALALFQRGVEISAAKGIILVDTKYEFGVDLEGRLLVVDEVHTPDSSRFWYADSYAQLYEQNKDQQEYDKEFIRIWLAAQGFSGGGPVPPIPDDVFAEASIRYMKVFEDITSLQCNPDIGNPSPRIEKNLKRFLGLA